MKNTFRIYLCCSLIILCFMLTFIGIFIMRLQPDSSYAMEQDSRLNEQYVETLSASNVRSNNVILISGNNNLVNPFTTLSIIDFDDIHYINNPNYFLINPKHHKNDDSDNVAGTCTTVAVQMLLGYHDYYSDRRIIPTTGNGRTFLNINYGDLNNDPVFSRSIVNKQGCEIIGTEDGVYEELIDDNKISGLPALGQAIGLVKDSAVRFIENYAVPDASDGIDISWGIFSASTARNDIDAGIPIVLGMDKLLDKNFHVVLAYGYAKLDGIDGFLVHYGWGAAATQVWVPENWFGFQLRMSVKHIHTSVETDKILKNTHMSLKCNVCGYCSLENIYVSSGTMLTGVNFSLSGEITIPENIEIYSQDTASFMNLSITKIGKFLFANQKDITNIKLHEAITDIGERAFYNCELLKDFTIPKNTINIGIGVFNGCNNLSLNIMSGNSYYLVQNNILYDKLKTKIVSTGKIFSYITIPNTVKEILPYAFANNNNIYNLRFLNALKIGDYAFYECKNLNSVYFESYVAPTAGTKVFDNNSFDLYVPYAAQDSYKNVFAEYSNNIKSKEIAVYFVSEEETLLVENFYYGSVIDFFTPTRKGYIFGGWYSNLNGTGTKYLNGDYLEEGNDKIVYAKWIPKKYDVILDSNGGTIDGDSSVEIAYWSNSKISSAISRTGYVFDGWYDNKNSPATQYFTANGESTRKWDIDKEGEIKLFAHWTVKSYEIQINNDGTITWLGVDGLSDDKCSIQYGTVLSAINLVHTFKQSSQGFKEGKIFDHFEYNDTIINWTSVPDLGESGSIITIEPVWILEIHSIYFKTNCDVNVEKIITEYNDDIKLPNISRKGYTFGGWYTNSTYTDKINWLKMPDLTIDTQSNGSIQLVAKWTAIVYTVSYLPNGGKGTRYSEFHSYNTSFILRANTFTRDGYNFVGWSTKSNGNVTFYDMQTVSNLTDKNAEDIALYAIWQPIEYKIIYKNLIPDMFVDIDTYTYGQGLEKMPDLYIKEGSYSRKIDNFYGWYTTNQFTTKVNYISEYSMGNITVYAKYDYWLGSTLTGSGTVTDSNIKEQPYKVVDLYFKSFRYDKIKSTTLNKIKITFSLSLWEVDDGYQDFYLYNGDSIVWSKTTEHGVNKKNTTPQTYKFDIELDILDFAQVDLLYLRFGAHGAFSDTWKFNNFEMKVYLTN